MGAVLDRRLQATAAHPLAVALSGGGDSLALTLIADAWARAQGRELHILTVDHRLQPASGAWTFACAEIAGRLGRPFRALAWEGHKPKAGLPAAARAARHRLLAEAAREAGARVLLMGHTADDVAEAQTMRAAGATTPDPHEWGPSPVWPEGRGIFLLRPLLGVTRAALRAWLAARGETWIEDPANADPRYARSRARAAHPPPAALEPQSPLALAAAATERLGVITLPREVLRQARSDEARRFTALAAVCAGGGERLPAGARIARLADALRGEGRLIATLAGARIQADAAAVAFMREPGEAARGGLATLTTSAGPVVWDGRFEITPAVGEEVRRLGGLMARLDHPERLRDLPPPARASLPALLAADGGVRLAPFESLVGERLRAAAGLVTREPPSLP